jgi:hypothetical protein
MAGAALLGFAFHAFVALVNDIVHQPADRLKPLRAPDRPSSLATSRHLPGFNRRDRLGPAVVVDRAVVGGSRWPALVVSLLALTVATRRANVCTYRRIP